MKALIGFPDVRALRRRVEEGRLLGPDIYTAGLTLDGTPPVSPFNRVLKSPADALWEVRRQKRAGCGAPP